MEPINFIQRSYDEYPCTMYILARIFLPTYFQTLQDVLRNQSLSIFKSYTIKKGILMISYGFVKEVTLSFDQLCEILPEELQKEGFGIITTIDMKAKLKEKLDVDISRYTIFGACNPPNAFKALTAEENIGLMLPCNVVVYEKENKTVLAIIKPTITMNSIKNSELDPIAREIEKKLEDVFKRIK